MNKKPLDNLISKTIITKKNIIIVIFIIFRYIVTFLFIKPKYGSQIHIC